MNNEMKKWEVRGGGTSADEDICVDARLHSDSDSVHCCHTLTPLDSRGRRC